MIQEVKEVLVLCIPVLVALIPIIPTLIANHKSSKKSMEKIQETLDKHIRENEDVSARDARFRIIRFNDELCDENRRHSESYFEDILEDIDRYEKYCAAHPDFKNSRGRMAMEHIKAVYAERKSHGDFLPG